MSRSSVPHIDVSCLLGLSSELILNGLCIYLVRFQQLLRTNPTLLMRNHFILIRFEVLMFCRTFAEHEELEDLSLGHSGKKGKCFYRFQVLEAKSRHDQFSVHRCTNPYPLHPRVLEDL